MRLILVLSIVSWLFPNVGTITGKVVRVVDGNTLDLATNDRDTLRISLLDVDCPELQQPSGYDAKELLLKMLQDKNVNVNVVRKDRWGTRQAIVLGPGDTDPRIQLLKEGLAWTAEQNADPEFEVIRKAAAVKRKGLWRDAKPTPPWIFRRQQTMLQPKMQ